MTFEKKLWLHFVDTVRRTVVDAKEQKLPLVTALFLAKSSQIISNPEHELYHVLNKFLLAKQAIDTDTLPEFLRMMHSSDPGHK
jgi:Nucleolar pre-ribosomal-associated protein 1